MYGSRSHCAHTASSDNPSMCFSRCKPITKRIGTPGSPTALWYGAKCVSSRPQSINSLNRTSSWRMLMMFFNFERNSSSLPLS